MFKTNRKIALAIFVKFLNLSPEIAESVYDGIVPSFTDYGYNGEDWQLKVLEHEVGRADKNLVQRTFDFSGLKALK